MENFEEKLNDMDLPNTAKELLPIVLTSKVKNALVIHPDMEKILQNAIEEINQGSVEKLNDLITKAMTQ